MDVIENFHNENSMEWKCLSRSCLICLVFIFVWIRCRLGENCFDSKTSGIDLACNSWVVVYPTAVPVSIIFKWEKSQFCIEYSRRENPYNRVEFVFASERGHIPSRSYKLDIWEGGNPCDIVWSLSKGDPATEDICSCRKTEKRS